jgi:flavin-binding protein dodecin
LLICRRYLHYCLDDAAHGNGQTEGNPESVNVEQGGVVMSMVKVIEVIAESKKSWDEAAENAVKEASKSVRNIKSLYVQEMQAVVEDGKITKYRLNAKITFVLD